MSSNINKRWEEGIPHHSFSIAIVKAMQEMDTTLAIDISTGGDGDNGETLMYFLDEWIDQHNGQCPGCYSNCNIQS